MTGAATRYNWYPINMYDTREGEFRDIASNVCKVNGVLNAVEIDVTNLRKWLKGTIGTSGQNVRLQNTKRLHPLFLRSPRNAGESDTRREPQKRGIRF